MPDPSRPHEVTVVQDHRATVAQTTTYYLPCYIRLKVKEISRL